VTTKASPDQVLTFLRKSLPDAMLHRIPRHPERRNIVLAILCLDLERRYPYSERELNSFLKEALRRLNATVDHVTCRRYLVDLDFVKRDRAGVRYFLNWPKVESTLSAEAIDQASALVAKALSENERAKNRNR
jgi:hypothetical protein